MSKLFDQLKDAARSREEKPSPGLLIGALQKHHAPPAAAGEPVTPAAPQAEPRPAPSPTRISSYSGIGLAVLIFLVAILAWHSAPFRPPAKLRIDPAGLKLDRSLDVDRITPKGTSPAGRPS